MAIEDFAFEVGADGSKIVWRPFRRCTQAEIARTLWTSLNVESEAARLAKDGIPAPDDMTLSSLEQKIRSAHLGWIKALAKRARARFASDASELALISADVMESSVEQVRADHAAKLGEIETSFATRIRPLVARKILTEGARKEFEFINKTVDQPTARSAVEFVGSTIITGVMDSIVSGLLFKEQMGIYSAIGFASGVGLSLALVGMIAGIGWAGLKRPSNPRKVFGGLLLAFGAAVALVLFFLVSHYRLAIIGSAPDRAAAVQASVDASPWLPFYDVPLLIFLCINLGALWLIAAKAATMFGWLDLARRRKSAARAARRVQRHFEFALSLCGQARDEAHKALTGLAARVTENNRKAKEVLGRSRETRDEYLEWCHGAITAALAGEQRYREVVQSVHPAGTFQPRFASPPESLVGEEVEVDPNAASIVQAIEARSVSVRGRKPDLTIEISAATDSACERIATALSDIEADLRMNGARQHLRAVK